MNSYYTVKNLKGGRRAIITFRKKFYARLKLSHPWAVCTWIGVVLNQLNSMTGKIYSVNYDQGLELDKLLNTWESSDDPIVHHMTKWFIDGTRLLDTEHHFDVYVRFAELVHSKEIEYGSDVGP